MLADDVLLPYNERTLTGHRSFMIQIVGRDNHSEIIRAPWPSPSTYVAAIDPSDCYGTDGLICEPDTDWEDEDTMGPEGDGATEVHDDYMSKKRQRGD